MELQFTFTEQETNLVLQALAELPAKVSMGLIMGIQAKAQQQIEQAQTIANADKKVVELSKGKGKGKKAPEPEEK